MGDLGKLLRQAREDRELTLAQAEADTHIRATYLTALEEGLWAELPEPVYSRGLAISYARYLGLDEMQARKGFDGEMGMLTRSRPGVGSHQPLSEPLYLRHRTWVSVLAILLLAIAAGVAIWWYWPVLRPWGRWLLSGAALRPRSTPVHTVLAIGSSPGGDAPTATLSPEPTAGVELAATADRRPTPTSAALPLPTPGEKPTNTPGPTAPTPSPTPPSGLLVRVSASAPAWLRAVSDGTPVFEGTLKGGESREWLAHQVFVLRTGNAGGTSVTINGLAVGTLGGEGEVVERTWLWTDARVVTPTPGV